MTRVATVTGTRFRKWLRVSSLIFLGTGMALHILLIIYEILGSRDFRVEGLSGMTLGPRLVDRFLAMFVALLNAACFYAFTVVFNPLMEMIGRWARKVVPTAKNALSHIGRFILIGGGIIFIGLLSTIFSQDVGVFPHDKWFYPLFGFFYLLQETSYFFSLGLLFSAIAWAADGGASRRMETEGS